MASPLYTHIDSISTDPTIGYSDTLEFRCCPGECYNIGYSTETHLTRKVCEMLIAHNFLFSREITLTFCTERGSITAVLCGHFQNDFASKMGVLDEWEFAKFDF